MPQHASYLGHTIIHYSTKDAVFRTIDGKPVAMEFHRYCGPFFEVNGEDGWMPEDGSPEWDNLWDQFNGWMTAKGHLLYPSPVTHSKEG